MRIQRFLFSDEKKERIFADDPTPVDEKISEEPDDAPLFTRIGKKGGHYSPVPGHLSPIRLSAFRNVGR